MTTEEFPEINASTNRFASTEGFTFDANGNVVVDAQGRQFAFNGDNKQTLVKDDQNNTIGTYYYDGEGKRIKKVVGDDTTVFVYSGSKLIAEYSTETPPTNPTTSYTITDQLGSPRVIVNALAEVVSRRDFMPFGEEIEPDETYRKSVQKYGQSDSVRQKFTGYQKDDETGLDFAEARMYENRHGRFTAVDPLLASGKSADPQSFNRYVYVRNSPVVMTDSTGMMGDYYDDKGRRIGTDGEKDQLVYFAKFVSNLGNGDYEITDVRPTTWQAVLQAATPQQPDAGRITTFLSGFSQGVDDAKSGAAKGAFNLLADAANSLTDKALLTIPSTFGIDNPLQIERYNYESSTERNFGVGVEVGVPAGLGVAASALSATSSLSVVPEVAPTNPVAVHGNSLSSLRPTWGYKLYDNDGTFLKNGITSQPIAEARYTKGFMADKNMVKLPFPNRLSARQWERYENTVNPGPLNIRR